MGLAILRGNRRRCATPANPQSPILALVLFAFVLALYFEVIAGAAGLGGGVRVASQAGARSAAWQRVLRGLLLSLDDVAQVARVAARGRKGGWRFVACESLTGRRPALTFGG